MISFYAESDGDAHAKTYYLCADCRMFRVDLPSMRVARALAYWLNEFQVDHPGIIGVSKVDIQQLSLGFLRADLAEALVAEINQLIR